MEKFKIPNDSIYYGYGTKDQYEDYIVVQFKKNHAFIGINSRVKDLLKTFLGDTAFYFEHKKSSHYNGKSTEIIKIGGDLHFRYMLCGNLYELKLESIKPKTPQSAYFDTTLTYIRSPRHKVKTYQNTATWDCD